MLKATSQCSDSILRRYWNIDLINLVQNSAKKVSKKVNKEQFNFGITILTLD